jgi:hypothetical protein
MKDKNGKELKIGDNVKVFTYKKGVIENFEVSSNGEERAYVRWKQAGLNGWGHLYSEEIRLVQNKS